jgi:hypothetical protein
VLAYRRPTGPKSQMPHFKTFIVADESQPKRFKGRIETVGRKCNRTCFSLTSLTLSPSINRKFSSLATQVGCRCIGDPTALHP